MRRPSPGLRHNPVPELMDFLWQTTRSVCPCDRMGLAFVMEVRARVVSSGSAPNTTPVLLEKGFTGDLRGSSLEPVIKTGGRGSCDLERYVAENPKAAARLLAQGRDPFSLTCPVIVENRTVGFLFRDSCQPWAMTEKHARFHIGIAERLAQLSAWSHRE